MNKSHRDIKPAEQKARDMLERAGVENAQSMSSGNLVEISNMINKSHRDIKGESILKITKRIDEIDDGYTEEIYVKKPTKKEKKGSWLEEFFLNRVWDFIKRSFEFKADAEFTDGHIYVDVFVSIAGRTVFEKEIKVI